MEETAQIYICSSYMQKERSKTYAIYTNTIIILTVIIMIVLIIIIIAIIIQFLQL